MDTTDSVAESSSMKSWTNKNAIVLIRGEKPVIDEKYDILKHPNIHRTEDGGAPPYLHTPLRAFAADDLSFHISDLNDIEFLED